ncbi:MAG: hypothetical protein QW320_11970 [Ignisphaera sp.]
MNVNGNKNLSVDDLKKSVETFIYTFQYIDVVDESSFSNKEFYDECINLINFFKENGIAEFTNFNGVRVVVPAKLDVVYTFDEETIKMIGDKIWEITAHFQGYDAFNFFDVCVFKKTPSLKSIKIYFPDNNSVEIEGIIKNFYNKDDVKAVNTILQTLYPMNIRLKADRMSTLANYILKKINEAKIDYHPVIHDFLEEAINIVEVVSSDLKRLLVNDYAVFLDGSIIAFTKNHLAIALNHANKKNGTKHHINKVLTSVKFYPKRGIIKGVVGNASFQENKIEKDIIAMPVNPFSNITKEILGRDVVEELKKKIENENVIEKIIGGEETEIRDFDVVWFDRIC